jgi:hypothetical protein
MALSAKFYKTVKIVILTLLAQSVLYLGIWLYLGLITIPYLSPIAVYIGDCLSPLTPLFDPTMAYVNLKQWLHPASKAYRKTMKRRQYIASLMCLSVSSLAIVYLIALRFSWVWDKILGLKVADGMCVGPCWKLWTELALLVIVCFVVAMSWMVGFSGDLWIGQLRSCSRGMRRGLLRRDLLLVEIWRRLLRTFCPLVEMWRRLKGLLAQK